MFGVAAVAPSSPGSALWFAIRSITLLGRVLLSRNRLNVAISHARCLAYLVCSPRLLEVNARSIPQMRLANALCRFVELSQR